MNTPVPPAPAVRAYDPTLRLIERTGQFLLTLAVALFIALGILWPDPYAQVWQLVLAHIVGGRAGNVLHGLNLGFPPLFIYFQCCLEDILILLLLYPPILAGYRRAIEWRILGPTLISIRESADRHKSRLEPFGVVGLMIFVVFPFWSTGALVGAVVGYLIGMRTWVTFTAVLIGNFFAVALWVWLFDRINAFSEHLTKGLLIAILAGVLITAVIAQIRSLRKERKAVHATAKPPEDPLPPSSEDP